MAEVWTTVEKMAGQASVQYNDASKTYNQSDLQYNGKTQIPWTNQPKN